jgi:hypothetical protein
MTACGPELKIRKILLIADLDYTHFNSSITDEVVWLGGKDHWIKFYHEIASLMRCSNVEMHFAVVTNKDSFDDIAEEAATAFRTFLEKGHQSMFIKHDGKDWCLVNMSRQLQFECLEEANTIACTNPDGISHFVVAYQEDKIPYIKKIAQTHKIPLEQCLVLDDLPEVLDSAQTSGIPTVSFREFCKDHIDVALLDDPSYVNSVIAQKKIEIHLKIHRMLNAMDNSIMPNNLSGFTPLTYLSYYKDNADDTEFLPPTVDASDPLDCLHSWSSRKRLFGNG